MGCAYIPFHHATLLPSAACANADTCMVLSSWSTTSMEEVAEASGSGLRWFQLYVYKDRALTEDLVHRAAASGYKALCVTIDTPVLGKRREDMRHGFDLPSHLKLANFSSEYLQSSLSKVQEKEGKAAVGSALFRYTQRLILSSLTWKDIQWLQNISPLPIVLKGVLTAEDAKMAAMHCVDGILVSNHGARQLDGVPATVSCSSSWSCDVM